MKFYVLSKQITAGDNGRKETAYLATSVPESFIKDGWTLEVRAGAHDSREAALHASSVCQLVSSAVNQALSDQYGH